MSKKRKRGTGPRQSQYAHGHSMFLPENGSGCLTVCKDCGEFIPAQLGHPDGIRCEKCHLAYLETIRLRRKG